MNHEHPTINLSPIESYLIILSGSIEAIKNRKKEITKDEFGEFLPILEIAQEIKDLKDKLYQISEQESLPNSNDDLYTNELEKPKLEEEIRELNDKLDNAMIEVDATRSNPRFKEYMDKMGLIDQQMREVLLPQKDKIKLN